MHTRTHNIQTTHKQHAHQLGEEEGRAAQPARLVGRARVQRDGALLQVLPDGEQRQRVGAVFGCFGGVGGIVFEVR